MTRLSSLIAALALQACATPAPPPVEPDHTTARIEPPAPEKQERPEFIGVITTRKSELVPVPFNGKLLVVDATPGAKVKKGQQLAKLDDQDLKNEIAAAIADEKAQASSSGEGAAMAKQAMADYSRMSRGRRAFSSSAIESKLAEARAAGARAGTGAMQAKATRVRRETLERQLSQSSIVAPFDGTIMMVKGKEGMVAQRGEPIARIFDPSDLLIRFAVPKQWRKDVKRGTRVELQIDGVGRTIWATVETITDEEAPIDFSVVEANIDDSKLAPDEVKIASTGRVYLADNNKPAAARKAVR